MIQKDSYTSTQLTAMVVLRLFIGWHFAYEGLVKILNPSWTSLPYLLDSKGFMSDFFCRAGWRSGYDEHGECAERMGAVVDRFRPDYRGFQQTLYYRGNDIACFLLSFPSFVYRCQVYDAVRGLLPVDRQEPGRDGGAGGVAGFSYLSYYRARPLSEKSNPLIV